MAPLTVLIGRSLNSETSEGLLLTRMGYSVPANFAVPAGTIRFWRLERVGDVDGRKLLGVQLLLVQVHHDLPALAAEGIRNGRALHDGEPGADEVVGQVERLLLIQRRDC